MNILLILLGALVGILGIIGSIVPALPGPALTYSTLFILYYIGGNDLMPSEALIYIGAIVILLMIMGNLVPIAATKLTGASKNGIYGSIIGSIIGLLMFPPLGVFFGAAAGAMLGEYYAFKDINRSIRAGIGTTLGAIVMLALQLIFSVSVFIYFILKSISLF